jgi:peptidoglycan hydrolase-like protein with peptidoglycan-binding domain
VRKLSQLEGQLQAVKTSMRLREKVLAGAIALALLFCSGPVVAQTVQGGPSVETISVTGARPVATAMDVIEARYGVLIDYVDPQFASSEDTESVSYRPGHATLGPRIGTISLQYTQVAGKPEGGIPYISCKVETLGCVPVKAWPEDGMTALIQQVLSQFATQGGQVFLVQKLDMSYGPRWEVFPEEARDRSGGFVHQPDILDANIYIPKQQRAPADMLATICDELTNRWGHKFGVASAPIHPFVGFVGELGAENVSAREALANLMGRTLVLRLFYAPDDGMYYVNIENLPYHPPPRPAPPPQRATKVPPPSLLGPGQWLGRVRTPEGVSDIQGALAKAGYLHTAPTTRWDANAADAIRRIQAANGLQRTGVIDGPTVVKLLPYLPMVVVPPAPPTSNLMYPALAYWLESTQQGQTEIQQALTNAGFYSGPMPGTIDEETRGALKAFQTANDLQPNGQFDDPTAEKLAPFLPEPQQRQP